VVLKCKLVSVPEKPIWNPVAKRPNGEIKEQKVAPKQKATERLQKFIIQFRVPDTPYKPPVRLDQVALQKSDEKSRSAAVQSVLCAGLRPKMDQVEDMKLVL